jgi:hypothetical protein
LQGRYITPWQLCQAGETEHSPIQGEITSAQELTIDYALHGRHRRQSTHRMEAVSGKAAERRR